ncbi:guanylate kinase [Candidatus Uhrbacteria bacterium]|nr:guanylate kinase [Candidatus Uhrbacteria bacterium]
MKPNKSNLAKLNGNATGHKIILLSAPSRGGKNAVIAELLKDPDLRLNHIITCTTRPKRNFEIDGVHYYFKTPEEFKKLIGSGGFLEWAEFNHHLYGTPAEPVLKALTEGQNPLIIIEVQGAKQIMEKFAGQTLSIFLKPHSLDDLRARFQGDPNFTPVMIESRLKTAEHEIAASKMYDYVIENAQGKLHETVEKVKEIILKNQ